MTIDIEYHTYPYDCAFPTGRSDEIGSIGLAKREYFAALALQGLLANPQLIITDSPREGGAWLPRKYLVETAVSQADALIAALNGDE